MKFQFSKLLDYENGNDSCFWSQPSTSAILFGFQAPLSQGPVALLTMHTLLSLLQLLKLITASHSGLHILQHFQSAQVIWPLWRYGLQIEKLSGWMKWSSYPWDCYDYQITGGAKKTNNFRKRRFVPERKGATKSFFSSQKKDKRKTEFDLLKSNR